MNCQQSKKYNHHLKVHDSYNKSLVTSKDVTIMQTVSKPKDATTVLKVMVVALKDAIVIMDH